MGRVFRSEETRSKALMQDIVGVLRSSRADVAGVQRACGRGAGNEGGKKPASNIQEKNLYFSLSPLKPLDG